MKAISEQRLPPASERPVTGLLDGSVNVRKSSFSAAPAAVEDSWPGNDEVWRRGGGGAEPHTCQMICHYRGVSNQLSPPNHPSYPLSQPLSTPHTPVLRKHPLHSSDGSGFTRSTATPSPPPSYAHPERIRTPCKRHGTQSALCGYATCAVAPLVCVDAARMCVNTYLSNSKNVFLTIPNANRWSRTLPVGTV